MEIFIILIGDALKNNNERIKAIEPMIQNKNDSRKSTTDI